MSSIPDAAGPRASVLAPFQVRSFRFQWPADTATSFAFEMETLILGWYVLVETQSVFMLTIYASLTFVGTLFAPLFGVMGDRLGHRNVLCAMRGLYAVLALGLMTLAYLDVLNPWLVLAFVTAHGLVRPSDIGMRNALIGETMPGGQIMSAMGIQRTSQDSARIFGALTGAGLAALLGMVWAYAVVAALYSFSLFLTWKAGRKPLARAGRTSASPLRDLKEGMKYVWNTPHLLGVMLLAFLLNSTTFPLYMSLLPAVAKDVYLADRTLLGYMVACSASGALIGSIAMTRFAYGLPPGRTMIVGAFAWLTMVIIFANITTPQLGLPVLVLAGICASTSQVPMATILARNSDPQYRGRVMGIRMLAIYGNVPGLLLAGPLISAYGYAWTATVYCVLGLAVTALILARWGGELWRPDALTNRR